MKRDPIRFFNRIAIVPLAVTLCAFKPAELQAQARSDGAAVQAPPARLSGSIQIGSYEPLEFKNQAKLWLTRFTSPAVLVNSDVAYVYGRKAFCGISGGPAIKDFYTARFAIARHDGIRYEVQEALQIKKVDFCNSSAEQAADIFVIAKERVGQELPKLLINWSAKGTIDGIADATTIIPKSAPAKSELPGETVVGETKQKVLDREYLQRFADTFSAGGVRLTTLKPDTGTVSPGDLSMRSVAISKSFRSPPPAAFMATPSYCLKDLNTDKKECSDTFAGFAEKIIANMKQAKAADSARSRKAPSAAVPVRFELDILN